MALATLLFGLALMALPVSAQWTMGYIDTYGGNAGGSPCSLPFTYKSNTYSECTAKATEGSMWCSTTPNYDTGRRWAKCRRTMVAENTRYGTAGRSKCAIPFTYNQQVFQNCTATKKRPMRPWCSTTPTYGKKWGYCVKYQDVKTFGGNVPAGTQCQFPFRYRGYYFHGCSAQDNKKVAWCATSERYDRDRRWGNCNITTFKPKDPNCLDGNKYSDPAPNTLSYGAAGVSGINSVEACEAECTREKDCVGFDFDGTSGANPRCFPHLQQAVFDKKTTGNGVSQYTLIRRCTTEPDAGGSDLETNKRVTTRSGNAAPRGRCVFPYNFEGKSYGSCNSKYWPTPWCSLSQNYNKDKLWGECDNIPMI